MFEGLPQAFKQYGLDTDVRTLLLLRKSIKLGLIKTFGDLFATLKSIVVKEQKLLGPFTKAYYDYFLNIQIRPGERLDDAIRRSETFERWKEELLLEDPDLQAKDMTYFIDRFLSEVHLTQHDIKQILSGREILDQDNPDMLDRGGGNPSEGRILDRAADYSEIDMKELLERMEKVRRQQSDLHGGGSHWIGQGGISPYGFGGAAFGGIRVGGTGGGKMARKVIDDPRYFPVDLDKTIRDDNVDAALASLNGVIETSAQEELDIPVTITNGIKQGGLFLPEMKDIESEKMQILLLVDNGGYSMDPHIRSVTKLFRKMKTRFAHDLEVYYFHNTIYDEVYSDERRRLPYPIRKLVDHDPNYCLFIIGDAAMAPYELTPRSLESWNALKSKFKKIAWLNPEPISYWSHTLTTTYLSKLIPMYPLTPRGIERAVRKMNKASLRP